jgi:hypothetical protein
MYIESMAYQWRKLAASHMWHISQWRINNQLAKWRMKAISNESNEIKSSARHQRK